ncbi:hypothetical protein DIPPA_28699 [Diplonema papillatum]|nr:hypothetical protein DIPPA_28699 [Diplonema papillatum]
MQDLEHEKSRQPRRSKTASDGKRSAPGGKLEPLRYDSSIGKYGRPPLTAPTASSAVSTPEPGIEPDSLTGSSVRSTSSSQLPPIEGSLKKGRPRKDNARKVPDSPPIGLLRPQPPEPVWEVDDEFGQQRPTLGKGQVPHRGLLSQQAPLGTLGPEAPSSKDSVVGGQSPAGGGYHAADNQQPNNGKGSRAKQVEVVSPKASTRSKAIVVNQELVAAYCNPCDAVGLWQFLSATCQPYYPPAVVPVDDAEHLLQDDIPSDEHVVDKALLQRSASVEGILTTNQIDDLWAFLRCSCAPYNTKRLDDDRNSDATSEGMPHEETIPQKSGSSSDARASARERLSKLRIDATMQRQRELQEEMEKTDQLEEEQEDEEEEEEEEGEEDTEGSNAAPVAPCDTAVEYESDASDGEESVESEETEETQEEEQDEESQEGAFESHNETAERRELHAHLEALLHGDADTTAGAAVSDEEDEEESSDTSY